MKIIKNEKLIRRNGRIGQIASLTGLAILAGGMIISFQKPELVTYAWLALLVGFILSQVGLFYGNRFGRHPRPDEVLDNALKGLDDRFYIYHYRAPVSHLLIGPTGLWILIPRHQGGIITYQKGRWRQRGGSFIQFYLRAFFQEGIGRPDLEIPTEIETMKRFLKDNLPEFQDMAIQAVLVMTNEKAIIEIENAPYLTIPAKKLKETVRKVSKENGLTPTRTQMIVKTLPEA